MNIVRILNFHHKFIHKPIIAVSSAYGMILGGFHFKYTDVEFFHNNKPADIFMGCILGLGAGSAIGFAYPIAIVSQIIFYASE